ncbi:unnamed protein product [Rotaria sp. Silwood2]|nr:unnamed protein product [Rotaria sp. Silwood2]CAF3942498.1 unnamed protein product [Rotaria sp. Silwood2]CAF4110292.1 unnamed protein product [Rotaria sp. Silwood2]CAF4346265.1 unnamed protein product [Rotaria sp. Silwood2]
MISRCYVHVGTVLLVLGDIVHAKYRSKKKRYIVDIQLSLKNDDPTVSVFIIDYEMNNKKYGKYQRMIVF